MLSQLLLALREFLMPAQLLALLAVFAAVMTPSEVSWIARLQMTLWGGLALELGTQFEA